MTKKLIDFHVKQTTFYDRNLSQLEDTLDWRHGKPHRGDDIGLTAYRRELSQVEYLPLVSDALEWASQAFTPLEYQETQEAVATTMREGLETHTQLSVSVPDDFWEDVLTDALSAPIRTKFGKLLYQGNPNQSGWHEVNIIDAYGLIQELMVPEKGAETLVQDILETGTTGPEIVKNLNLQSTSIMEAAFSIGFLYRDAWWKREHEAAAQRYYEIAEQNRVNGQKGGQADKKAQAIAKLSQLAFESSADFLACSDSQRIRKARQLASDYDAMQEPSERLFHRAGRLYAKQWFDAWLSEFLLELSNAMKSGAFKK
ncbi:hypothetical protein [Celeribacter marinus]|uniref:Uncharacterized protein n=1 Tax=Celeribacter marinus TaxID=1397108 RepID=A0A0N9ZII2_9RHOB|nr:hypothetical protein [Celeribacter marinus]ALI56831.1 hypothetical protein IMCC12053_2884 [Celeribacter marinus]SFK99391.1 hypothetical protein SAMN05444421_11270 [Celeribacter marinus]